MGEVNQNLWAPWRMDYIRSIGTQSEDGCFLCRYAADPSADVENLVIWRTDRSLMLFNRFPYSSGHLLIAPLAHLDQLDDLDDAALTELIRLVRDAQRLVRHVLSCHGSNIGMNFGRCAGAGVVGHLHVHLVPRWEGDINFMPVLCDNRVIPESIEAIRERMREAVGPLGLPPIRG